MRKKKVLIQVILDSHSGLNWLPILATEFMTINQVLAETRLGGCFDRFRFATTNEVQGLFIDAFGVSNGSIKYSKGYDFMKLFGYDLGSIYPDSPGDGPHDAYLSAPFDAGLSDLSNPLSPTDIVGVATVGIHYFKSTVGTDTSSGSCSIGQCTAQSFDTLDPEVSHAWLVEKTRSFIH